MLRFFDEKKSYTNQNLESLILEKIKPYKYFSNGN